MSKSPRCLYDNSISAFNNESETSILGRLIGSYHGEARTTTIDAWKGEISIMQETLGMVICVPKGNPNKTATGFWEDSTRLPEYYDGTYKYLKGLGIEEI